MSGRKIAARYTLVSVLGRGGTGVVWAARDEALGRDVAIKEVSAPAGLTAAEQQAWCQRIVREVRAAAEIEHRAIVTTHEVIEEDGVPWIVMELVRGRSLQQILVEDGPLPTQRVAEIGRHILGALMAAHDIGVVHRAVRPSNILLRRDGQAVLTDFGVASAGEVPAATFRRPSSTAYVAPERLRGPSDNRPESDLWSLGASLRQALAGPPIPDPLGRVAAPTSSDHQTADGRLSGPLASVLEGLLRPEPGNRMPASLALALLERAAAEGGVATESPRPPTDHDASTGGGVAGLGASAGGAGQRPATWRRVGPLGAGRPEGERGSTPASRSAPAGPSRAVLALAVAVPLGVLAVLGLGIQANRTPSAASPPTTAVTGAESISIGPAPTESGLPTTTITGAATSTSLPTGTAPVTAPPIPPGGSPAPTTTGPIVTSSASPFPLPVIPQGYFRYVDASGFSIGAPNGWTVEQDATGVWIREPGSGNHRELRVEVTAGGGSPLTIAQGLDSAATYPLYSKIGLASVPYLWPAADLEYTWFASSFGYAHVNERVVVSGGRRYVIRWQTPDWQWDESRPLLDVFLSTFVPAP